MTATGDGTSDAALVRRAQRGDRDAFDDLVGRHARMVLSLARRVTAHREDAEDVAQDVFVRFFRTIGRIDPERPVEAWLVRLTLNAAKSAVSRSPRRREEQLDPHERGYGAAPDPGRALDDGQFRQALLDAATSLSEREREVFLLRDVQELDVSLIAEALGVSEVTVRRQSADGRRKIMDWFRANRPEYIGRM